MLVIGLCSLQAAEMPLKDLGSTPTEKSLTILGIKNDREFIKSIKEFGKASYAVVTLMKLNKQIQNQDLRIQLKDFDSRVNEFLKTLSNYPELKNFASEALGQLRYGRRDGIDAANSFEKIDDPYAVIVELNEYMATLMRLDNGDFGRVINDNKVDDLKSSK